MDGSKHDVAGRPFTSADMRQAVSIAESVQGCSLSGKEGGGEHQFDFLIFFTRTVGSTHSDLATGNTESVTAALTAESSLCLVSRVTMDDRACLRFV